jgi:Spy/CpxP family protein refolding chaperone
MERLRYVALGTVLAVALAGGLAAGAQQSAPASDSGAASTQAHVPSVDQQMKVLTEKLNLTADQQEKLRPILQRMHEVVERAVNDPSLSHEQREDMVRPEHTKAHEQAMQILNEDQKQKLAAYMQGPHPEMRMDLGGVRSTQAQ